MSHLILYTCMHGVKKFLILILNCPIAAPSLPPSSFSVTGKASTIITASWQLPPADSRNGIIRGFKLFYKKKSSAGSPTMVSINSASTRIKDVTGLDKYMEYEFQVLTFTSVGDGPKSSVETVRTKEDGEKLLIRIKSKII